MKGNNWFGDKSRGRAKEIRPQTLNQMELIGRTDRKLSELSEPVKAGIEYADTSQARTDGTITQK